MRYPGLSVHCMIMIIVVFCTVDPASIDEA